MKTPADLNTLVKKDKYQVFLLGCPCGLPINFATHNWFVVNNKGIINRWEVLIKKNCCEGVESWGYLHKNVKPHFAPLGSFTIQGMSFFKTELLGMIEGDEGSDAQRMAEYIEKSPTMYPHTEYYHLIAPNSNSYIQWILDQFPEFPGKLAWNAFGKGYNFDKAMNRLQKMERGNTLTTVLIIIALIIVGGWLFLGKNTIDLGTNTTSTTPQTSSSSTAKINGKTFNLLVADTEDERELGLGNRDSLPQDQAMIFVFDTPDTYEFWMKDMKFPIDMIWLDSNFKVVYIQSNVAPSSYPDETFMSNDPALYVLETNANVATQNNLKVGDVVEVSLKK